MLLLTSQIKAILSVLDKANKHNRDSRLQHMTIQRINGEVRLALTDSFIIASWLLEDQSDDLVGKIISNRVLHDRYRFTPIPHIDDEWVKVNAIDDITYYPSLNKFFDDKLNPIEKISIDGNKLLQLQKMSGAPLQMYFRGEHQIIVCKSNDPDFLGVLTPMRVGAWIK